MLHCESQNRDYTVQKLLLFFLKFKTKYQRQFVVVEQVSLKDSSNPSFI